jgi:LysM domain.
MENSEYVICNGDSFYRLAQRFGGTCEDWMRANPHADPAKLQIGQIVVLPELKRGLKGQSQYAEVSSGFGKEFAGEHFDEVEMEVEGVVFRVRRVGEGRIPHEIHFILPRTEIHKVQPNGENGPCEVQIMISNLDIIHSPREIKPQSD